MARPRTTLVSVDLDDLGCYHAIHGLGPTSAEHDGVVLERCLPRFLALFRELGIAATFFVIGRDLERDREAGGRGRAWLRRALEEGHELANHSHAHAYDLVRWPREAIRGDLRRCDAALRELGAEVIGFRAPGYTHDAALLSELVALGYRYDSSLLPSPLYYAAKLGVIAGLRLRGRRSRALARGARAFFGPREPHRLANGLLELPISVTPWARLPLIGTSVLSAPAALAELLLARARTLPYFHLELHGLDLADPTTDPIAPALRARQPELRTPFARRRGRLHDLLRARGPTTRLRDLVSPPR